VAFKKKMYSSIEQMQQNLDQWLGYYNEGRIHSGKSIVFPYFFLNFL